MQVAEHARIMNGSSTSSSSRVRGSSPSQLAFLSSGFPLFAGMTSWCTNHAFLFRLAKNAGAVASLAFLVASCLTFRTVSVPQKTSLEKQLIGDLEPLTEEEFLAATVRASAQKRHGSSVEAQEKAVRARSRQLFNRDDIDELKAAGCLGEAKSATVAKRDCKVPSGLQERLVILIEQENTDRQALMDWALLRDPVLTRADRDKMVSMFHRFYVESLDSGMWYQNDAGRWVQK